MLWEMLFLHIYCYFDIYVLCVGLLTFSCSVNSFLIKLFSPQKSTKTNPDSLLVTWSIVLLFLKIMNK